MTAVVLGNGLSRQRFDLLKIHKVWQTYGCNAIYRDFVPHNLFAMDFEMAREIVISGFHNYCNFYTAHDNERDSWADSEHILFIPNQPNTIDTGSAAVLQASLDAHQEIYLVGFDREQNEYVNNLYSGTENYPPRAFYHQNQALTQNWRQNLRKIIDQFPDTTYYRVNAYHDTNGIIAKNSHSISEQDFVENYELLYKELFSE